MKPDKLRRDISIFKGTSKEIEILFRMGCKPYEMQEEDTLILQVIDYRNNDTVVIEKEVKGDNYFSFIPSDTEELNVGFYRWNIKFKPQDTEDIYEVVSPSIFHIKAGE